MWVIVGRSSELAPETVRVVKAGALELALVATPAGLYAIDNACPHAEGPLGEGMVQGTTLTCPLHGWQFDTTSGACLNAACNKLNMFPVKTEGEAVLVQLPDPAPAQSAPAAPAAPPQEAVAGEWIAVAKDAEALPGSVRKVIAQGRELALACTHEGVFALDHACVHEGGPLGEGRLDGTTLTCPLHGYQFDCRSGACLNEPRHRQPAHEAKREAGQVWVRLRPAAPESATPQPDPKRSAVELWKSAKHGLDVWPDLLRYAQEGTLMAKIDPADLERMKWYGYFYRKNNDENHYMCRIRIPGCELTSDQARAVAFVAYEAGYSIVDVTTRGNVQVQGLTIEKLPGVRAALEAVGLTSQQTGHDNVRNITSHPFSGIDPQELMDTRPLARQIQELIVDNREFSNLPRKFNIALSGRPHAGGHAWTQDLTFVAARGPGRRVGFQVLVGGKQGQQPALAQHLPVWIPPEQVLAVTAALLRTFYELGDRHNRSQVRFHYLIERLGLERLQRELEARLGAGLDAWPVAPPNPAGDEQPVGWFKQKQHGLWALGVCVPVGRLTWEQFEGLAVLARRYGSGALRTTTDQNVVIPDVPEGARSQAAYALARHGLTFEPDSQTRHTVACTGKQFCNLAVTETKGYAYHLIEELRRRNVQLHGINLHISGCPSSCANTYTADIGLKGTKTRRWLRVVDAFDIYLGGGLAEDVQLGIPYKKAVPYDHVPPLLEQVIQEFYLNRTGEQTFSQYWRRKLDSGKPEAAEVAPRTWRCTHCGRLHLAEDPPPICPACSAIRAKFEPVEESAEATQAGPERSVPKRAPKEVAKSRPKGKRIVIVGGGIAGHTAADHARSLDPDAAITLLTDERHSFYNRLNLTRLLAQEVRRDELFDYGPDWYAQRHVEVLTGVRAIGLDPLRKHVLLSEGRELPYDACILAHGSAASTPSFFRPDLPGCFLLRTLEDVDGMIGQARSGMRVAVVGGGVLGLEAAYGLVKRGAQVQVFEYGPRLMPRQLDPIGAGLLLEQVREKGIEAHVQAPVKEILGQTRAEGVAVADGRRFDAELVIVSTGIAPNIDWVQRAGLRCERGVSVDDRMLTSAEGVYAAGDVAQWRGQVVGLWNHAIEQAKVAASNAVGTPALFRGALPVTLLKCLGIPLVSLGEILPEGPGVRLQRVDDPQQRTYRCVVFREGLPVGGMLLGTLSGMGELRRLIESGLELEHLKHRVLPEPLLRAAS